jgi:asparagine synthase (glutamine-hydrolysing)
MSGFVCSYGEAEQQHIEKMIQKIKHRGPFLSGLHADGQITMAQNYLYADLPTVDSAAGISAPYTKNGRFAICYDGQIGNWAELAKQHDVADGPFREERLLLRLYEKHGREMLKFLDDAIFAFVIKDGDILFAARDLLGIKTLFYAWENGTFYLASELKAITAIATNVAEFPEAHYANRHGDFARYADLPDAPPAMITQNVDQIAQEVRKIIEDSIRQRVDFARPTAGLLSGGMDSSVICALASRFYKAYAGKHKRLKTFSIGVRESGDILNARLMAEQIGSEHHELIVDLDTMLSVLPDVVYALESFDPSLVRSSVSNYLISRYAKEHGVEVLLSGEGGDEVFCGYMYLKESPAEQLFEKQMECLRFLHNNASLRLDRMNQANSIRVVAPLISGQLLHYAMQIPAEYKQKPDNGAKIEKWIFRKAYESILPDAITWRLKQEFSQGSGAAGILPEYFDNTVSDQEFHDMRTKHPVIRSKEECYYFSLFAKHFGSGKAVDTVGQWIRL